MGFGDDVAAFEGKTLRRLAAAEVGVVQEVWRSLVDGSEITGSPGQPVVSGDLKGSWEMTSDGHRTTMSTKHAGAPSIEFATRNGRALQIHSPVGGSHSLILTRAGFQAIVDRVVENEGGYGAIGVQEGQASPFRLHGVRTKRRRGHGRRGRRVR